MKSAAVDPGDGVRIEHQVRFSMDRRPWTVAVPGDQSSRVQFPVPRRNLKPALVRCRSRRPRGASPVGIALRNRRVPAESKLLSRVSGRLERASALLVEVQQQVEVRVRVSAPQSGFGAEGRPGPVMSTTTIVGNVPECSHVEK